jgi:hypothetical protein
MIHERIYEITVELPNEDWIYRRLISTFHEACVAGLSDAKFCQGKLIRVAVIPEPYEER